MAKKIEIELDVKSKKAQEQIENLNEELKDTNKNLDSAGKEGATSVGILTTAFRGLGTAMKAMGIGLVIAAFAGLFTALKNNQKVLDGFNIVMGTISQVFTQIGNVLVTVYENVSSSTKNFDALGKVMGGILTLILTPFKLVWDGIKLAMFAAQLAWEESFFGSGDTETIDRLNQSIKETKFSMLETALAASSAGGDIVTNFSEAISEVGDIGSQVAKGLSEINIKAINDNIAAIVQLKKDADRARVANQGLIEQYDRQAEQQRQIRDNDLKNIDDRVAANDKLKEILDDQNEKMLENAAIMIKQAQAQFKLTGLEEDYLALQEALNEEKAVEAQIEGFMSEQESNRVALLKEKIELELSNDEATALRQNEERNFVAEMEQSEVTKIQTMIDNLEIERQIEEDRLLLKRNSYKEGTQAWQDANNELLDSMQASNQEQDKLDKDLGDSKLALTKQTLGALATIVGKSSKFGKGIAIAQAIMDTYAGANKALSAAPPPYNFIQAAAVIAAGLMNVKTILKTKSPAPPSGLGARGAGDASVAIPTPPAFNIVGQGLSNQLADVISSQQPMQTFVVSNDVTTAQELDRNIITGASLG